MEKDAILVPGFSGDRQVHHKYLVVRDADSLPRRESIKLSISHGNLKDAFYVNQPLHWSLN